MGQGRAETHPASSKQFNRPVFSRDKDNKAMKYLTPIFRTAEDGPTAIRARRAIAAAMTCFCAAIVALVLSSSPGAVFASSVSAGNPIRGKELFEKRCGGCHSLDADKEGPRLHNVYGRKAGSIPSFKYSSALKSAQITWDAASLDRWLTDTESVVPDNDMDFHVPRADERADIIEFLRVSSGK
jgi:cytochrome c